MLALTIIPGVAALGALYTGFKAMPRARMSAYMQARKSRAIEARRRKAIQAVWAQMPRTVMSVEDVRSYHHSHRGVYEYA